MTSPGGVEVTHDASNVVSGVRFPVRAPDHLASIRLLANDSHRRAKLTRIERWKTEADEVWARYCLNPLFGVGIGLYWGEGEKGYDRLSLCNSDPQLIETWLRWCRAFIPGCALRARLQLHADVDPMVAVAEWQRAVGVNVPIRVYWAVSAANGKRKPVKQSRGTLTVLLRQGSTEWFYKMARFIEKSATTFQT
jgi:hypothetical protein